jgi:hypothetical protein
MSNPDGALFVVMLSICRFHRSQMQNWFVTVGPGDGSSKNLKNGYFRKEKEANIQIINSILSDLNIY